MFSCFILERIIMCYCGLGRSLNFFPVQLPRKILGFFFYHSKIAIHTSDHRTNIDRLQYCWIEFYGSTKTRT